MFQSGSESFLLYSILQSFTDSLMLAVLIVLPPFGTWTHHIFITAKLHPLKPCSVALPICLNVQAREVNECNGAAKLLKDISKRSLRLVRLS